MATTTHPQHSQGGLSPRPRALSLALERGPTAPATARHQARSALVCWGLGEDQIYDILLVISELVTNAITHALPPVVLHLFAAGEPCGRVRVHVSDGGLQPVSATWAARRPADEHGRGTMIVTALAHETGTDGDVAGLIDHWADLSAA
ncbi:MULTISPECIES: ATP-binding protein [unclassified Streptomyces]|uniref:ATP-binding protein n=1 Tax=Streptomyces sp. NPDC017949 TaxID=3365020 RepID=UPI0037B2EB6D